MTDQKVWKWTGDSREDKAKRVALSYRQLLEDVAAGRITDPMQALIERDRYWQDLGVYWAVPSVAPVDQEAWLSAADLVIHLAHIVQLTEHQVRNWAYRRRKGLGDGITERTGPEGKPEYNVADVLAYLTRQRVRRQGGTSA
ncbi:hypothetical protein [Mycobacteroides abscessus]|uniref:hypothetical protein n=1 Tax=Mycobacteroides abscessus TaxID=36809 RepID=UPI00078D4778|nr:hypothetical protein [Mycobacteroides abscessus]AMU58961.1 hypothetical protein A3O03_01360 [Mycobacteroides abscessus]AMU73455.1 hypothetical protein A3O06_01275 [Mycobacteroides abscessus]ANO22397.1 hypothetical protein BAB79_01275 [Mycobacteroides abscessus]SHY93932.1 Uncharacterised protein [Mycobacteroides abscessus subsp. abscessus]SHZ90605.1 Uncharacterised protein [Mycobacteroides abscessus subsp. abscessus]